MKSLGFHILLFSFFLNANTLPFSYQDLCKYDNFCARLKNKDGSFVQPKQSILAFVTAFSDEIKEKSNKLGIDPKALAGAIVGENSMNVQVDDVVQDFLVQMKLTPKANILGKQFSIGIGQIYLGSAMEAEKILAEKLGRKIRTEEEVAQILLTPSGAIEYAGGIIKHSQDCYQKEGFDVSKNPALLTTLYNLGKACDRAKELKRSGKQPKPNYFGYFTDQNLTVIDASLNRSKENSDYQEPKGFEVSQYLDETIAYSKVPSCNKNGAGQVGEYNQARSYNHTSQLGIVKGNFRVISRDVDCDLKSWVMIVDSSGRVGWLPDEELKQKAKIKSNILGVISPTTFDCNVDVTCIDKLKGVVGKNFVNYNAETGFISVKYIGKDKRYPADPTKFHEGCLTNQMESNHGNRYAVSTQEPSKLTNEQIDKNIINLEKLKKTLMSSFDLSESDWSTHPFNNYISNAISSLQACKNDNCRYYPEQIKKLLSIKVEKNSLSEMVRVSNELANNPISVFKDYYPGMPSIQGNYYSGDGMLGMQTNYPGNATLGYSETPPNNKLVNQINSSTAEEVISTLKKCRSVFTSNQSYQEELDKISIELSKLYPKTSLNAYNLNVNTWLCDRALEKINGQKPNNIPCDRCMIFVNLNGLYGQIPTNAFATYLNDISTDDLEKIIKDSLLNVTRNISYQVPALQTMNRNNFNGMNYDTEKICNYDPFKNKEQITKLLNNDCVSRVLTNDSFLIGSFRQSKKQVVSYKTANNDEYTLQIQRNCGKGYMFFNQKGGEK